MATSGGIWVRPWSRAWCAAVFKPSSAASAWSGQISSGWASAKDGFEAVQVAALPDGTAIGVKIADGSDRARLPVTVAALALAGVDPDLLAPFGEAGTARGLAVAGELRDVLSTTIDKEQL